MESRSPDLATTYDGFVNIKFNQPRNTGVEHAYVRSVLETGNLVGGGPMSNWCSEWLNKELGSLDSIITTSATDALEIAARLLELEPGDEIIVPSYTFVSSANAFVAFGAVPVFVDIRSDTLNIDESLIEKAITNRTKAIVVVHYGGNPCEMDSIMSIAARHGVMVIEDAAQAILSTYKGRYLGTIGHLGCLSFHGTKNIVSGEGGALLVNDSAFIDRAHVLSEKGTNRRNFIDGKVDKYSWIDYGSSHIASEITAAVLKAQLEKAREITKTRKSSHQAYLSGFTENQELLSNARVRFLELESANGHMFPVIFAASSDRDMFIERMAQAQIQVVTHYVPLHSSKFGVTKGRTDSEMEVTDYVAAGLVRLPMWSAEGLPVNEILGAALESIRCISQHRAK
jgi:dTDP-4-amino-4,6-dideoxygalactose transaminase